MNFECPHCQGTGDKVDERWMFDSERIQSSDELNIDPRTELSGKIELWYCYACGQYFRVYYALTAVHKLIEQEEPGNHVTPVSANAPNLGKVN